jgi:hypothetical protein
MCNKIKKRIISNRMLKFIAIMSLGFLMLIPPTAGAYSTSFDFGEVAIGAKSTTTVSIHNEEKDAVVVTGLGFSANGCSDFSIVRLPELMLIPAGENLEIDVDYFPSDVGECSNVLRIWTGTPIPHTVAFYGTGIMSQALFEDKIQEILAYVDTHLTGAGPGNSADHRLDALRNSIELTAALIKNGQTEAALHKLSEIYEKADDFSKPKDFMDEGSTQRLSSTGTLAGMIKDLMILLESDAAKTKKLAKSKATP